MTVSASGFLLALSVEGRRLCELEPDDCANWSPATMRTHVGPADGYGLDVAAGTLDRRFPLYYPVRCDKRMNLHHPPLGRIAIVLIVVAIVLGTAPGLALAQSERGVGGTVVVAEGETVDDVSTLAGTVVVDGTVTGDVSTLAGNVYVNGEVGGDVSTAAGNVEIAGGVGGDVSTAAGNLEITGTVGGDVSAAAGNVGVDGVVDGDVAVAADSIVLGDAAAIGGDLRYGGTLEGNTDAVAGDIVQESTLGFDVAPTIQPLDSVLFALYALALNLLLGAALLALFPRFSADVATRVAEEPARAGLAGLVLLVGVPILLVAIAITVIGIPFSLAGAVIFAFLAWIALVYGRFAVAAWALTYVDVDDRWIALIVGLVGGAVIAQVPFVGGLVNLVMFLLGLGALSLALYGNRDRIRETPSAVGPDDQATG